MTRITKTPYLFATALALLVTTLSSPLTAQEGGAPAEPIGFIELEGIGRFDVYPIAEGIKASKEGANMTRLSRSTAYWHGSPPSPERGGSLAILALRDPDDPTQGSVRVEFVLLDDRDGFNEDFSRGITYFEPYEAGTKPGRGWHQMLLASEVTIEEMSVENEGPMTLKLRFAGKAQRQAFTGEPSSEVILKGVLEVEGLPWVAF
jgi:hypothetical protein